MLIALETITNAMGRPFGLDFYFEKTCGVTEWRHYDRHFETWDTPLLNNETGRTYRLFVGPLLISMGRTLSRDAVTVR